MQKMEQTTSEMRALTDAELDEISGAFWAELWSGVKAVGEFIISGFQGPGDQRRPTQ